MHKSEKPNEQKLTAPSIQSGLLREQVSLLDFFSAATAVRDKVKLKLLLTHGLKELVSINGIMVLIFDSAQNNLHPYLVHFDEGKEPEDHFLNGGKSIVSPKNDALMAAVINTETVQSWTMSQLMKMSDRPDYITRYRINNLKKVAAIRLVSENEIIGALFIFSDNSEAFEAAELNMINLLIHPISSAVINSNFHNKLLDENQEKNQLISLMKNLRPVKTWLEFEQVMTQEFGAMFFFEEAHLFLNKAGIPRGYSLQLKKSQTVLSSKGKNKTTADFDPEDDFIRLIKNISRVMIFQIDKLLNLTEVPDYVKTWKGHNVNAVLAAPILDGSVFAGAVILLSNQNAECLQQHLNLTNTLIEQVAIAHSEISAHEKVGNQLNELNRFKSQLEIENSYLQQEIQTAHNYSEIIGTSNIMKQVFHLVSQVSSTNSSVLILGETGTGKELIARAIHNGSPRKDKVMIKVNCATLPANLIESELFGHERGSFTGAMERRIGKFELANNSTIFLDEIGEMPLGLQVKLLRVLQEKEIERVGGKTSIKTDVRVIAATNRNLYKEVLDGNFRSDLYFRLNVFPITIPALRERKEDIPLLTSHFVQKYASKLTFSKTHFTSRALKQLIAYNWPGNVRELEHLVERSILVARGKSINEVYLPGSSGDDNSTPLQNKDVKTIDEVEREHIISVLKMVNGKVSGIGGAAEILKIPATTLMSKIHRLNIKKEIKKANRAD